MAQFILVLDLGTTGIKACIMDGAGRIIAKGYERVPQIYPHPGWVEQDPMALWTLSQSAMRAALAQSGLGWEQIAAIGMTNQRETTILWDAETGEPVYNAVVWQCRRTADWCQQRKAQHGSWLQNKTGLVLDAYFSASKIRWLLDHVPEAQALLNQGRLRFGTVESWILWQLTGGRVHATDLTNASRTMLLNIHTQAWDPPLLEWFGVPQSMLPQVYPSRHGYGETDAAITDGRAVPIHALIGDQQSALYGQRCWQKGQCKSTYGTGAFLMMHLGQDKPLSQHGLLTTLACDANGQPAYAFEGAIFIAGAALEWLRHGLGIINSFEDADQLAASLEDNGGVYMVPAFTGLGAPHWDSTARGLITGLTQGSGKAQIARAAYEAMAYQTHDVLTVMQQESATTIDALKVDGGVSRSGFMAQWLANVLQIPVRRFEEEDLTAKGAGYLAGLGCGLWASSDEIARLAETSMTITPDCDKEKLAANLQGWRQAVMKTLA